MKKKKKIDPARNPIDVHVGQQLRYWRVERGLSQTQLAESVKLTFQQIQKYETGANRISASRLYQLAGILHISILTFFEGLPNPEDGTSSKQRDTTPVPLHVQRLMVQLSRVADEGLFAAVVTLVREIINHDKQERGGKT